MDKCSIHDLAMKGLREDIHDLKTTTKEMRDEVRALRRILTGNGNDGLTTKVSKNTDFRIESDRRRYQDNLLWKRVLPSIVSGVLVGVIMLLFSLLMVNRTEGGILDSLSVSFSERRAQTSSKRDYEITVGVGKNRILRERENGIEGWGYDIFLMEKFSFILPLQTESITRYRGVYEEPVSLQVFKLTNQGRFRIGGSFTGEHYADWKRMIVVESSFIRKHLTMNGSVMTDFAGNWVWFIDGGPRLPIGKRLVLEWRIDHWGNGEVDYGGSKLVLTVKFNQNKGKGK